jgi:hypothetical protein
MKYEDITFDMLGTKRQRPMLCSEVWNYKKTLSMENYPLNTHEYVKYFLEEINTWIRNHKFSIYKNLDVFDRRDAILGTTHQLDELHWLYKDRIATFKGEYKYHRRLTDFKVKQIKHFEELDNTDVLVVSCPSCITAGMIDGFEDTLDYCNRNNIPVHIDGAWLGQCRNFELDVSHPAIQSVSVSLSKALAMGSNRIGIRYSKNTPVGPISIMNDFQFANISDMWLGVNQMQKFGSDYWWKNYSTLYSKVCADFELEEADSIHIGWYRKPDGWRDAFGIRTPLRFLIDGIYDERGTDKGLNNIEKAERK